MRERMIDEVVKILVEEEDNLSDGYVYYCDPEDETLRRIAERIVDKIVTTPFM